MELHQKISHNIKKFRELKNITRKILADHLDMTLSGYAKIEQGNVDITIKKLESIAEFLDVELYYMLDFDASKFLCNSLDSEENLTSNNNYRFDKNSVNLVYFQKLIESLERENALLREKLSQLK